MVDQAPPTEMVEKPWGKFEQYTHNIPSTVKVITVRPGAALPLQYHNERDELWVVLDFGAQVEVGDASPAAALPRRCTSPIEKPLKQAESVNRLERTRLRVRGLKILTVWVRVPPPRLLKYPRNTGKW